MSDHTLLLHSLNLGALTLLFFIVGMIRPKWALFFMEKPTRWLVTAITTVCVMIVLTMYGEGNKQARLAAKHKKPVAATVAPVPVPVPEAVPVPVPDAAKAVPKSKPETLKK
jgi:hypothetical protein